MDAPSSWLRRWAHLLPEGATVLDVACGRGRNARWLASRGMRVTGLDRDHEALEGLRSVIECVHADLEGAPWPLPGRQFDGVIVTNYLWRPLWPDLLRALAPCGVFLVETFAQGQQSVGRPRRPEFLLQHGELLQLCQALRVVAYEDGVLEAPLRYVQRIVATAPDPLDRLPGPPLHAPAGSYG
ncbi:MAG: class I SAM-dependent methyltransferase [Aquabacterium sp.]|nr:class I SAM-dependent methyltransferase [Aquabacterium sp.]